MKGEGLTEKGEKSKNANLIVYPILGLITHLIYTTNVSSKTKRGSKNTHYDTILIHKIARKKGPNRQYGMNILIG